MIRIGRVLRSAKKGERITVYLKDGTSVTAIAQNDLVSTEVMVAGNKAFSQDTNSLVLSRNTKLLRSINTYEEKFNARWAYLFEIIDRTDLSVDYAFPCYSFDGFRGGAFKLGDGSTPFESHTQAVQDYLTSRFFQHSYLSDDRVKDYRGQSGTRFHVLTYDKKYFFYQRSIQQFHYKRHPGYQLSEAEIPRNSGKRSIYCQVGNAKPSLVLEIPYDEPFSPHLSFLPNQEKIEVVIQYGKLPQRPYHQTKGIEIKFVQGNHPNYIYPNASGGGDSYVVLDSSCHEHNGRPISVYDSATKKWAKVKTIQFDLAGQKTKERINTNPSPIEVDPDNWQYDWLSTYSDYRGTPNETFVNSSQEAIDWLNANGRIVSGQPQTVLEGMSPFTVDDFAYNLYNTPPDLSSQETERYSYRTGLISDRLSGFRTAYCDRRLIAYDVITVPSVLPDTDGLAMLTVDFVGFGGMTKNGFVYVEPSDLESSEDERYYTLPYYVPLLKTFPGLSKNIVKGLSKGTVTRKRAFLTNSEITQDNPSGVSIEFPVDFPLLQIPAVDEGDYNFLGLCPIA